ncbi:hypothetical protein FKM82_030388 [Ascaphus truei]
MTLPLVLPSVHLCASCCIGDYCYVSHYVALHLNHNIHPSIRVVSLRSFFFIELSISRSASYQSSYVSSTVNL